MIERIHIKKNYLLSSKVAKDSFWAVFGNAMSLSLILLTGIIVARLIGKEYYGHYGTIKNLMTAFASLAAFGLGYGSTRLISFNAKASKGVSRKSLRLVLLINFAVGVFLFILKDPISVALNKPEMSVYISYIIVLMLLKSSWTVTNGILAGYKKFKQIGIINIAASVIMVLLIYPFTKNFGLNGAIFVLMLYHFLNLLLSYICIKKTEARIKDDEEVSYIKLFKYTLPIAIHEMSATFSGILLIFIVLHFSSYGEYALYTIAIQWSAIINIIPSLLMNVTLSYLSSSSSYQAHNTFVKKMLSLNFCCTIVPFFIIFIFSDYIVFIYGRQFYDLPLVLRICVCASPLMSLILVFQSNLISEGRNWSLAIYKLVRDVSLICLLFILLRSFNDKSALVAVSVDVFICAIYLLILLFDYIYDIKKSNKNV